MRWSIGRWCELGCSRACSVVFASVWNVFLAAGLTAAPLGYNHGLEAGELPLLAGIPIFSVLSSSLKSKRSARADARTRRRSFSRDHTWCHDGEGGGIVDGSRLNTRPIALAYAVRKRKWDLRHSSF
jgi:hypothetical protein